MSDRTDSLARDLLLRCGRYIPDPAQDGDARVDRLEAYLVALSEELEALLPVLSRALSASSDTTSGGAGDGEE